MDSNNKNAVVREIVRKNRAVEKLSEAEKDLIPKRICPLCMSELKRDEPLYAGNTYLKGNRTILIYGCQYCYRTSNETANTTEAEELKQKESINTRG
jgi:hypothetical protein